MSRACSVRLVAQYKPIQRIANVAEERFFYTPESGGKPQARAVMVDTERKVIATAMERATRSGTWEYTNHKITEAV